MTTAYLLGQAGYDPEEVHSEADVTLERSEDGFSPPSNWLRVRRFPTRPSRSSRRSSNGRTPRVPYRGPSMDRTSRSPAN
jgi:hypothetical protein